MDGISAQITTAGCSDHNLWHLSLHFIILSFYLSVVRDQRSDHRMLVSSHNSVWASDGQHPHRGQACKTAAALNTLNLVSFVALSGLEHCSNNNTATNKYCEQKTKPEMMKIITAASMLASVLCLPEPEAGLGVEDMDTLIRLVSTCQHQAQLTMSSWKLR